jgi:hypothetical protein
MPISVFVLKISLETQKKSVYATRNPGMRHNNFVVQS